METEEKVLFEITCDGKLIEDSYFEGADATLMMSLALNEELMNTCLEKDVIPKFALVLAIPIDKVDTDDKSYYSYEDSRFIYRVDRMPFVLNVTKTGVHRVIICLFSDKTTLGSLRALYLKEGEYNKYHYSVTKHILETHPFAVAYREFDFVVPQDALAKKPQENPIAKFFFKWVNEWMKLPYDECQYRRRALWVTPLKFTLVEVPLFTLRIIFTLFLFSMNALYKTISLIFGFQHDRLLKGIQVLHPLFILRRSGFSEIFELSETFGIFRNNESYGHRIFKFGDKTVMFWFSPIGLAISLALFKLAVEAWNPSDISSMLFRFGILGNIIFCILLHQIAQTIFRRRSSDFRKAMSENFLVGCILIIVVSLLIIGGIASKNFVTTLPTPTRNNLFSGLMTFVGCVVIAGLIYRYRGFLGIQLGTIAKKASSLFKKSPKEMSINEAPILNKKNSGKFQKSESVSYNLLSQKESRRLVLQSLAGAPAITNKNTSGIRKLLSDFKVFFVQTKRTVCKPYER
ncbi:MAG TPA: hypothetical protein VGE63_02135 [Candidatus Paceibacterota bacterium]